MSLARTLIAPLNGWKQPGANAAALAMCQHVFEKTPDGQIAHYTDTELRATVPPKGWDAYAAAWGEEFADLAAELRGAPAAAVDLLAVAQAAIA